MTPAGRVEFNRVVFGKNSAPMESQFVAQENARRNQDRYPLAAEMVLKSTYMDDSNDSVENDEEGVELYRQLKALYMGSCQHASPEMNLQLTGGYGKDSCRGARY